MNRDEIDARVRQWQRTGYGVDPQQPAFRHYPGSADCQCYMCAGTPIKQTRRP